MLAGSLAKAAVFSLVNKLQGFANSSQENAGIPQDFADASQNFAKDSRTGFRSYAINSFSSTLIGQFVDNLVFTLAVSHRFFGWSMKQVVICAACCALFEMLCGVIFSPIGYRLARREAPEI